MKKRRNAQFGVRSQFRLLAMLLVFYSAYHIPHSAFSQTGLTIELVSEVTSITPGQPFHVGLFIKHEKGWHTYWKQPGVVGMPIGMTWRLPRGFEAGTLLFPEPQRVLMYQIKAQGYERDLLVSCEITPPATLKDGDSITLGGVASWMCCGNTCHPGFKDMTLTLPVKTTPAPAYDEKWRPVFEKERTLHPQTTDAWSASAISDGKHVTLTLKPTGKDARVISSEDAAKIIFFTDDGWIHSDKPQLIQRGEDGTITMKLEISDVYMPEKPPGKLSGLVWHPDGWLVSRKLTAIQIAPEVQ
jgi:DsbC/DsbD-like thiol-disulfide interchange protein